MFSPGTSEVAICRSSRSSSGSRCARFPVGGITSMEWNAGMKIAVWHNLPSGGGKRALYDHVRGLVARGHSVEVWCPPTASRTFLPLDALVREHVVDLAWPV